MKRFYRQLATDITIAVLIFLVSLSIHEGSFLQEIRNFGVPALIYYGFHIFVSLANRKFETDERYSSTELFKPYLLSWLYSSCFALLILVTFQISDFSRLMILTNMFGLLAGESLLVFFLNLFRKSVPMREPEDISELNPKVLETLYPEIKEKRPGLKKKVILPPSLKEGNVAFEFASKWFNLTADTCQILETTNHSNILGVHPGEYDQIINFQNINHIPRINHFFEAANSRLPMGGLLMVCAETTDQRKNRILKKYPPLLNRIYYLGDYLLMRVFPMFPVGKKIYFALTKGQSRVISTPEVLGRLISCGFEIAAEKKNTVRYYVVARKIRLPAIHNYATYGPLIHLNRIGKDGKIIKVYKLRTMFPYSEYVYNQNKLTNGGKIKNDFRITAVGKFLRRYWLDELPGLYNWLCGEVKIVGVRPLSRHYFNLYTSELQQKRIQTKPGLIPPFYADLPQTLEEIMESEMRYLECYEKAPLRTDVRYFLKAMYNIVLKGVKSQ